MLRSGDDMIPGMGAFDRCEISFNFVGSHQEAIRTQCLGLPRVQLQQLVWEAVGRDFVFILIDRLMEPSLYNDLCFGCSFRFGDDYILAQTSHGDGGGQNPSRPPIENPECIPNDQAIVLTFFFLLAFSTANGSFVGDL